jgi:hypothetical protein
MKKSDFGGASAGWISTSAKVFIAKCSGRQAFGNVSIQSGNHGHCSVFTVLIFITKFIHSNNKRRKRGLSHPGKYSDTIVVR